MAASRISRIGTGSAEATTITIPAGHQAGDIIFIFAFRDGSTTNPTVPAGWNIKQNNATGTLCSISFGWKIAASGSETSGTWTNATGLICHVYRGVHPLTPFGRSGSNDSAEGAGTAATVTWGDTRGSSTFTLSDNCWLAGFVAHRSIDTTTLNTGPTGQTNVINAQTGVTNNLCSFDTNGPVQVGFASSTPATGGTASGWMTLITPIYPASFTWNNYQSPHSISAGVISVTEKIR